MTTAIEVLQRTYALGARLLADGEKLELDAPADFPEELIELLRKHKTYILEYVGRIPRRPAGDDIPKLLAWANDVAEEGRELHSAVCYVEAPQRTVTTTRVAHYAGQYLTTICSARIHRETTGRFGKEWWQKQEQEALRALAALQQAISAQERQV